MDVEDKTVFYDKLRFIYLEMPHFTKKIEELETHYDKWLFVLKNLSRLKSIPEKLQERIFMKVFETADTTQYTTNLLSQYQDSLKDYRDMKNIIDTHIAEGLAKGKAEVAVNLMKEGFSDEKIQQFTGLSLAEITHIRQKNGL